MNLSADTLANVFSWAGTLLALNSLFLLLITWKLYNGSGFSSLQEETRKISNHLENISTDINSFHPNYPQLEKIESEIFDIKSDLKWIREIIRDVDGKAISRSIYSVELKLDDVIGAINNLGTKSLTPGDYKDAP